MLLQPINTCCSRRQPSHGCGAAASASSGSLWLLLPLLLRYAHELATGLCTAALCVRGKLAGLQLLAITLTAPFWRQMLRKAGWEPGMGLGAEGQGPTAPIALAEQSGRHGIGAGTVRHQQQPARGRSNKADDSAAQEGISLKRPTPAQQSQPASQPAETLDAKVRRHRQVLQAEADEAAERNISRSAAATATAPQNFLSCWVLSCS